MLQPNSTEQTWFRVGLQPRPKMQHSHGNEEYMCECKATRGPLSVFIFAKEYPFLFPSFSPLRLPHLLGLLVTMRLVKFGP